MIEALRVLTGDPRVINLIGTVIFFACIGSLLWWKKRLVGEILESLESVILLIGCASIFLFPLVGIIYFLVSYYQARPLGEIALGLFGYLCGAVIGGLLTYPTLILSPSPGSGPSDIVVGLLPCFAIFVVAVVGLGLNSFLMFAGVPLAAIAVDIIIPIVVAIVKRDDLIKSFQKSQEEKYQKELKKYESYVRDKFIEAVESGDTDTVNSLIQSSLYMVKRTLFDRPTTLWTAIEQDRIEIVKALIQAGAVHPVLLGGEGNENTARFLVEAGIDVNARGGDGSTALIYACIWGFSGTERKNVAKLLIQAGADVNAQRDDGWTALMGPAQSNADRIPKRLVDPKSNKETWVQIPTKGHVDTVKNLIEAGADVNVKAKDGSTALMCASTGEVAKILIEAGADINAKDKTGETALMSATRKFRTGIVKVLIEAGADVNAANPDGETGLKLAVKFNDVETINVLREAGADVNAKNQKGRTALMYASESEVAKILIEAGADVNAKDQIGSTAIMYGLKGEVAKILIEAGADVNAKDQYGRTALMYASKGEVAKILIEAGADLNAKDKNGETALKFAVKVNNTATINVLREAGATD